jgi:hypothetical protein
MPWKECNRMDERLRFVARLLDGEKMALLCRAVTGRISNEVRGAFETPYQPVGLCVLCSRPDLHVWHILAAVDSTDQCNTLCFN